MSIDFEKVNSWARRELIGPELFSSYVQSKPLLYFIAGQNVVGKDRLGDPRAPGIFGGDFSRDGAVRGIAAGGPVAFFGRKVGKATVMEQLGSWERQVRFQHGETDDAVALGLDDPTNAPTVYADDLVEMHAHRWVDFWAPLAIRKDRVDAARGLGRIKGSAKMASLMEQAISLGVNQKLQRHQSNLFTGTLTEAQQSQELWGNYLGLDAIVSETDTDFYGGKKKGTYPELKGNVIDATVDLASTVVSLRIFRQARLLPSLAGVFFRYANAGNLVILHPALWEKLADDSESKHRIDEGMKIPGHLLDISANFPVIRKDNMYFVPDPDCASGVAYQLTPEYFLFEIEGENNFVIEPWTAEWRVNKAGKKEYWTNVHGKSRLISYRNDLQIKFTGLTTS